VLVGKRGSEHKMGILVRDEVRIKRGMLVRGGVRIKRRM
jgi:hypothetical protein